MTPDPASETVLLTVVAVVALGAGVWSFLAGLRSVRGPGRRKRRHRRRPR